MIEDGQKVIIEGYITSTESSGEKIKVEKSNDIYSGKETVTESIGSGAIEVSTEIAKETVLSTAIAQAQSIGASGVIALSSATYFQADAIVDNSVQIVAEAAPMIQELNTTGTITPPEGSKFSGQEIPKTKSFMGIKVGEGKKEISKAEQAVKDAFANGAVPNNLNAGESDGSDI